MSAIPMQIKYERFTKINNADDPNVEYNEGHYYIATVSIDGKLAIVRISQSPDSKWYITLSKIGTDYIAETYNSYTSEFDAMVNLKEEIEQLVIETETL